MKKRLLLILCILFLAGGILSLYAAITVSGSGFLDLSNLIQIFCFFISGLFAVSCLACFILMRKV